MPTYVYWVVVYHQVQGLRTPDCLAVCSDYPTAQKILDEQVTCTYPGCDTCRVIVEAEAVPYLECDICYDTLTSKKILRLGAGGINTRLTYNVKVNQYYPNGIANTFRESRWKCQKCNTECFGPPVNRNYRNFMRCDCGFEMVLPPLHITRSRK